MAICLLPARGRSLAAIADNYSAFELLLGTWPYAPTTAWGRSLAATRSAITLRLSYYCLVRGHLLTINTSAWTFSRSYYWTAPCMSGSGIINHPLRDELGLKTKKVNHHSSEYSRPATHVRQGSWANVCVTRCMCEYSREHSCAYYVVDTSQYWERVLISFLLSSDPKTSS